MNYEPQVGDRVRIAPHGDEGDVLFAYRRQAVVKLDCDIDAGLYGFSELAKVEPRPKVRQQNIGLSNGGYISYPTRTNARIVAKTWEAREVDRQLGQTVTVAVVCDLDGNPLEVAT